MLEYKPEKEKYTLHSVRQLLLVNQFFEFNSQVFQEKKIIKFEQIELNQRSTNQISG